MAPISRNAKDHQRRVLEHQTRMAADRRAPDAGPVDPQMRIPLVGEVKRNDAAPQPKRKKRLDLPVQPKLGDL